MKIKSFLPVFPGFYGTLFEPSEDHIIEGDFTYDDYTFDYNSYQLDMSKACVNAIEAQLNELGFKIGVTFEHVVSPREYNFTNDSINVTYKVSGETVKLLKKYLIANLPAYSEYLTRYKSRSGFISYYSYDVSNWLDVVNLKSLNHDAHCLGSILDFVLTNEDYDSEALRYDRHCDSVNLDGWLTESEDDFLQNFIEDENYQNIEVLEAGDFNILGRDKETKQALYYYRVSSDCTMVFNMFCEIGEKYKAWFTKTIASLNLKRLNGESISDVFDILENINPNQLELL